MAFLDETGLAELWELIKAEDAKAPKIATGSYKGTGTATTVKIACDFTPVFIAVVGKFNAHETLIGPLGTAGERAAFTYINSDSAGSYNHGTAMYFGAEAVGWDGTNVSFAAHEKMLNRSGETYNYILMG